MASTIINAFLTSLQAVLTVWVVYFFGFLAVYKEFIDAHGVKTLSKLSNHIFVPLLFFVRLGEGLDLETLKNAWTLPVIGVVVCLLQFLIAYFVHVPIAKPTDEFKPFYVIGQATSNFIALPLVLVSAVCSGVSFTKPDHLLTEDELNTTVFFDETECRNQGDLYMFLYSLLVSLLLWTVGYEYAASQSPDPTSEVEAEIYDLVNETEIEEGNRAAENEFDDEHEHNEREPSAENDQKPSAEIENTRGDLRIARVVAASKDFGHKIAMGIMRPATLSQFIGIGVGLFEPLQNFLFETDGVANSLASGIGIVSEATTSVLNLILSCSLALKIMTFEHWSEIFGHEERHGVSKRTLLCFAFLRMCVTPGIMFGIFQVTERYLFDIVPASDPLQRLVIYLQALTPTSNQIVLLTQVVNQPRNGEILANGILLQYVVGIFSITGYMFLALYILDLI